MPASLPARAPGARAARISRRAAAFPALAAALLAAACADGADRLAAPPSPAPNAVASADGTDRSPAPRGKWTVMVYLAADNNLALDGVTDLDEMEAAVAKATAGTGLPAVTADVRVVMQGEFSRGHLALAGCQSPRCVGLSTWNTFRYAAVGRPEQTPGHGPAGVVTDLLGDRDMTRPEELREFVQWAKREYPADHYMLVLWNHGGGYTGLIADDTSAPNRLMTIEQMRAALAGTGKIDVLDFDMCLMAGYETLAKLYGLVDYTVFSEAVVPGAGNDYRSMLGGLFANPQATPAQLAAWVAESFHRSYLGQRASTTISAYALARYPVFAERLEHFASALRAGGESLVPVVRDAASRTQRYEQPGLHDLGHLLAELSQRVDERTPLYASLVELFQAATDSSFRLRSYARTGSGAQAADVSKSTGLHVLLPSGQGTDVIAASGPGSFEAYAVQMPDAEWTRFLADYLRGGRSTAVVDQGDRRFEAYLVWDSAAVSRGADVDFWLLEPDGSLYIPYLGRVTPNGQLTNDSWEDNTYYEGWASFRVVARGAYYILANLYDDPSDFRPRYNLGYRFGPDQDFTAHWNEPGQLSMQRSWQADSTPTLDEAFDGKYTDLQAVAVWRPDPRNGDAAAVVAGDAGVAGRLAPLTRGDVAGAPRLTPRQLATARRLVAEHRAARRALRADVDASITRRTAPAGLARLLPH